MGINFYIGETGVGKTTLAQQHAAGMSAARGVPVVIMDPEGVLRYESAVPYPHIDAPLTKAEERDAKELEDRLFDTMSDTIWKEGKHVVYHVRDEDDANRFFRMVKKGGNVVLLVDECSYWVRGSGALKSALSLCRTHRLYGVDMLFTTQYPADLNPLVWNVKREVYMFTCKGTDALDRLQAELVLSPETREAIRTLPPMEFRKWPGVSPPTPGAPPAERVDPTAPRPATPGDPAEELDDEEGEEEP